MNQTLDKDIQIRLVSKENYNEDLIEQIVDVHMKSFIGFFLTFLGRGFLKQLYKGFLKHPQSSIIVASKNKKIVGFLAYSKDLSGLYKYLIKTSLIPFAWYSLGAFFRKPSIMMRLFRALYKPRKNKKKENYIELASIGVLPEMRNQNIASRLIEKLKNLFDKQKYSYIKLETDNENNEGVNRFYLRNGFELVSTYKTPEGRKMNIYIWK